jgi:glyoxylase-like metal-dependent hydrolase (beta-lactamase superfamily II)
MTKSTIVAMAVVAASASAACGPSAGTLGAASETLGVGRVTSIEFSGTGKWFQFGQAANPTLPWPQFDVSRYTATVNYETPAARVQMTRLQAIEPGRVRPVPQEQRVDQHVSGRSPWNLAPPAGVPAGTPPVAQPQPAALSERLMEIWTTPHGFLKSAASNGATSQSSPGGGSEVTFTMGGTQKYVGTISAQNVVEKVQTWIDNSVMGDTLVEVTYADYRDFGGVMFPARIVRTLGGHPVLDLTVSAVTVNVPAAIAVPAEAGAALPPVTVTVATLADGVFYLKGGTHHSVAVDQKDHIVVVEGPQDEARSEAVIAKVKETIPNKPIRYLINTHVHFDHSGGLRTYVAEGATIVTHQMNRAFYEQAWAAPRTIAPDRLARAPKAATFETFTGRHVLSDGGRSIEVHQIAGGGHNDAFAMVYLPAEKILIEGDAYTPVAVNAPRPAVPNPYSVNLYENIRRLKLDVQQIAALHGPRLTTMDDLAVAIGQEPARGSN